METEGKRIITLALIVATLLLLVGCGEPKAEVATGEIIPEFSVSLKVEGSAKTALIDSKVMEDYTPYKVTSTSTNSYGTKTKRTFVGYRISDVLDAAKDTLESAPDEIATLTAEADDGYETEADSEIIQKDTTLLALIMDGETEGGPWFAPCSSKETPDYVKKLKVITVEL